MNNLVTTCCLLGLILIGGCSTVPKEVVELSYITGQDIQSVHYSYAALTRKHFDTLRTEANNYLNNKWIPAYLNSFIKEGELVKLAQNPDSEEVFNGVSAWVELAVEKIDMQRKQLIDPINADEKALIESIDESFSRLMWANSIITAHLNSLRKVQDVQDEALKSLKMKDIRDKTNKQLANASERALSAIKQIEKVEDKFPELERTKKKIFGEKE
jgi:hypothetical protein